MGQCNLTKAVSATQQGRGNPSIQKDDHVLDQLDDEANTLEVGGMLERWGMREGHAQLRSVLAQAEGAYPKVGIPPMERRASSPGLRGP